MDDLFGKALHAHGLKYDDILSYKKYGNDRIVFVTHNGMKYSYIDGEVTRFMRKFQNHRSNEKFLKKWVEKYNHLDFLNKWHKHLTK